jgi:hypothetical protein
LLSSQELLGKWKSKVLSEAAGSPAEPEWAELLKKAEQPDMATSSDEMRRPPAVGAPNAVRRIRQRPLARSGPRRQGIGRRATNESLKNSNPLKSIPWSLNP